MQVNKAALKEATVIPCPGIAGNRLVSRIITFLMRHSHRVLNGAVHHLFLELLKYIHLDQISYNL